MGVIGVYEFVWAKTETANSQLPTANHLIIRCSSADPVPHQLDLRVAEERSALRHAVARGAGAGGVAGEIRIVGGAARDELDAGDLGARHVDDVAVGAAGSEDQPLLPAEGIVAA